MKDTLKLQRWIRVAFIFFILAGALGLTMRLAFVTDLPEWIDYRNVTHTHSHIAMMGWLFSALLALIVHFFDLKRPVYSFYFWGSIYISLGMFVSFLIQGYAFFSIVFTSLHLLLSYGFIVSVFKDLRNYKFSSTIYPVLFLKTSLIFLVCSTLGTWMLGLIMGTGLKGSALYYGSIQFFLHFQFNGWFIFSAIALFLQAISTTGILLEEQKVRRFYFLLTISCVLTYALAVTWSTPDKFIFWINSIGVIIQFTALVYFLKIIMNIKTSLVSNFNGWTYFLLSFALASFSAKILIQTFVAFPFVATMSYTIKNFVIGFIHLLMLGAMSTFVLAIYNQVVPQNSMLFKSGTYLFIVGFILSEILLFFQGLLLWMKQGFIPGYYLAILLISLIMAIGIIIIGLSLNRKTPSRE